MNLFLQLSSQHFTSMVEDYYSLFLHTNSLKDVLKNTAQYYQYIKNYLNVSFEEIDTWLALCLQLKESNRVIINQMLEANWDCLFFLLSLWLVWKTPATLSTNQMQNWNLNFNFLTCIFPHFQLCFFHFKFWFGSMWFLF